MSTLLQGNPAPLPAAVVGAGTGLQPVLLFDDPDRPYRVQLGVELFEPNCVVLMPARAGQDDHPLNAYDIAYPYCRSAIRVRLDDADPDPLLAQVTDFSRFLSLRVIALVCGAQIRLDRLEVIAVQPGQTLACAATAIVQPTSGQGFLVVDATRVVLPVQVALRLTGSDGSSRLGWINVLPPGWVEP